MPSWLRPRPRDDIGRALVQQFEPDGAAKFARAVGRPGARHLDELTAALHPAPKRSASSAEPSIGRISRDRRIAVAVEHPQAPPARRRNTDAPWDRRSARDNLRVCQSWRRIPRRRCPAPPRASISGGDSSQAIRSAEPDPFQPGTRHDQRVRRSDLAAAGQPLHLPLSSFRTRVSAAPRK